MKLMMQKWCWIGLILCASGTAWAAKGDDADKPASSTKKSKSDKADSKNDSAKDDSAKGDSAKGDSAKDDSAKDDSAKDDSAKDDSGEDEETEAPAPPPKKVASKEKAPASSKSHSVLNLGALLGYGTSPFTRVGIGLRGGLTLGGKEGPYVGIIGTYFLGSSVTQSRLTGQAERTRNTVLLGAEGGYDVFASTDFLVRPYMQLGMAFVGDHWCATGQCWDDNGVRLTIAPGAQATYLIDAFYLGGDLRYQIILNKADASAAIMSLVLGVNL
jgi:hypothetical protein